MGLFSKITALLVWSAVFCSSKVFSETADRNHRLYIGPSASWYNASLPPLDEGQNGCMYGAITGYDYLKKDRLYAGAHFSYLTGKLTGSFANNSTKEIWPEARIGYRIGLGEKGSIAPFTGYGYFAFLQKETPSDFQYRFMYIPLGFQTTWKPVNFLEMGLNAMGGIPFASKWSAGEKYVGNTRLIAYVEVPFRFFLAENKRYDLAFVPYWRNWSIRSKGLLIAQVNNIVGGYVQLGFNL
ncbi:MAG: hypothetical protein K2Y01_08440 [Rhabdochlamydiaceae bacterium]|nr:hypothetical protein [Rhabdochlamydiaceae bacterium]